MKNILPVISFLVLLIALVPSCRKSVVNKEDKFNDYLPLKVGAKYKYEYTVIYSYGASNGSIKKGECTWNFISMSVDTPFVYKVEQTFTGYYILWYNPDSVVHKDSTHIENEISTLNFTGLDNGKIDFSFDIPYWNHDNLTFERFIQSERTDTCFTFYRPFNRGCLRKNVGITSLDYTTGGNNVSRVQWVLIEGPTY